MAKGTTKGKNEGNKYKVSFKAFKKSALSELPTVMLLFLSEKVLFDEFLSELLNTFIGKNFNPKVNLQSFFADETSIDEVINECSNMSFLSDKKIILYKLVKKTGVRGISKEAKEGFINYAKNPNPDNILILLNGEKAYSFTNFEDFENTGIKIYTVSTDSEQDIADWCRDKLKGYEIDNETILHLLQFVNPSYDEISSELEKLKTFCIDSKKVTPDDVNLCVGMTKDFNENNLFESILKRNFEKAIGIYDNMSSKTTASSMEVELRFVAYMNNLFISLHKMQDPAIVNMPEGFDLFRELKLWNDGPRMYRLYKSYIKDLNILKIKKAFDYIYQTDKTLKFTEKDKRLVINNLIHNLVNL
jgi:DNA polymerase-3 subunit delta